MVRKLRFRAKIYEPVAEVEPRFAIGDVVHETDTGAIGTVEFIRRDGQVCLQWPSGTREWLPQDSLCGPLVRGDSG